DARPAGVGRIGNARDGELLAARTRPGFRLAARRARLPGPFAPAGAGRRRVLGAEPDHHRMGIGEDEVLLGGAPGIFALALHHEAAGPALAVVAECRLGLGRPAQARWLVAAAGGRAAGHRRGLVAAVGVIETALRAPHDVGRNGAFGICAYGPGGP